MPLGDLQERRFAALTLRRVEVLALVEQNYSQREIADRLNVSRSTVRTHVRDLEALFECANMGELARQWALEKDVSLHWAARLANVRVAE